MVEKIAFKNFKIFKNWQTLELRPITILFGKNNSGKSAVAKLPTLIESSLSGKFSAILKSQNEGIVLGLSYEDLVYNKFISNNLEFEIANKQEQLKVGITGDSLTKKIYYYRYQINGVDIDVKKTKFKGFVQSKHAFKKLTLNYDYIGALRITPASHYTINPEDEYEKIGIQGANAYPILIQWSENKDPLFREMSRWYETNFEGWKLKVTPIQDLGDAYAIELQHDGLKSVNLINVGQGISQALSLIVRSFMPVEEDILIIIEEPETHLHPAAHGNLAQRFVESYLENNHKKYLIETHSQNFILRMQRLVAEGKLKKEDLALYYVDFDEDLRESSLKRISVDDDGDVEWWPDGIFNESLTEVIEIRNAQDSK
jgi:predicted ATPase